MSIKIHHSRIETREKNDGPKIENFHQHKGWKPHGLWYQCEYYGADSNKKGIDFWKDFAKSFEREYDRKYEVFLNNSNILFISNEKEFNKFNKKYKCIVKGRKVINWEKVSEDYDGIEICPFLWKKRMNVDWYYSWDVASGCIWRSSGIEKLVLIELYQ